MNRLLVLVLVSFSACFMGCAAKIQILSDFEAPVLLNGKNVLVTSEINNAPVRVGSHISRYVSAALSKEGVLYDSFSDYLSTDSTQEKNKAIDFAKKRQADFLLILQFTKVVQAAYSSPDFMVASPSGGMESMSTGSFSHEDLKEVDILGIILDLKTDSTVWKGNITVKAPAMNFSTTTLTPITKSIRSGVVKKLKEDGFLK